MAAGNIQAQQTGQNNRREPTAEQHMITHLPEETGYHERVGRAHQQADAGLPIELRQLMRRQFVGIVDDHRLPAVLARQPPRPADQ